MFWWKFSMKWNQRLMKTLNRFYDEICIGFSSFDFSNWCVWPHKNEISFKSVVISQKPIRIQCRTRYTWLPIYTYYNIICMTRYVSRNMININVYLWVWFSVRMAFDDMLNEQSNNVGCGEWGMGCVAYAMYYSPLLWSCIVCIVRIVNGWMFDVRTSCICPNYKCANKIVYSIDEINR